MPRHRAADERNPGPALANLEVQAAAADSIQLKGEGLRAQISVLAVDLFRLRIVRGQQFSPFPSWAAARTEWPPVRTEVVKGARKVAIQSARGVLSLNLADGCWDISDAFGLQLFSGVTGSTCFAGTQAQITLCLNDEEAIFGLGETTGTFNKRGLIREFWNIDVGGHTRAVHANQRNLYISIPFAISLRHGRAAGLFWDNPGTRFGISVRLSLDPWTMRATGSEIDLYFFLGPTCREIVERYTELTGRMPLPPKWALGYHQCRYSYETQQRVEEIAATFRRRRIPCDAVYLDIHYMDGYRVFTFGKRFPSPGNMISRLARKGFKVVTIVDPGVKDDPRFRVLQRGAGQRTLSSRCPMARRTIEARSGPGARVSRFSQSSRP